MTKREGIVITAYTGTVLCNIVEYQEYVQELLGRPVMLHEIPELENDIKEKAKKEFFTIIENQIN